MVVRKLLIMILCLFIPLALAHCGGKEAGQQAPAKTGAVKAGGAASGDVLATIDGEEITQADFDRELERIPHYAKLMAANPEKKKEFIDQMITNKLLLKEAKTRGIDEDEDILARIEDLKTRLITEKLMKEILDAKIEASDGEMKDYYDEHTDEFTRKEQVRASHILIDCKPEATAEEDAAAKKKAQEVLAEVQKGGDFAELAKKHSEGPTARRGGDLGYFSRGRMAAEFDEAVFALAEVGDKTGIFKTKFGYHIATLTGRRDRKEQTFDEVKRRIEAKLKQTKKRDLYNNFIEGLKAKADISINEDLLGQGTEAEAQK